MTDTSPEIAALIHARIMGKTGAERFLMGVRMHEAVRRMVIASFAPGLEATAQKALLKTRFYATGETVAGEEAPQRGMEEKSKEFVEAGAEVYTTA